MAFCTKCGAAVGGNFCNNCGTPAVQAAASGQMMPPPPPPRRGTHPLVWVFVIILGLVGMAVMGAIGTAVFVARNPGRAVRRLVALNPNVEVLSTDDRDGTITIRDRRTGKVVTMTFDQARLGRFRITADDGDGQTAEFQLGGEAHPPSWVPAYPGSSPRGLFSASGDSGTEGGDAGSFQFTTPDTLSKVLAFYEDQARDLGMRVRVRAAMGRSKSVALIDEERDRGVKVLVSEGGGETTVTVTYGRKI